MPGAQVAPRAGDRWHRARSWGAWLLLFAAAFSVRSLRYGLVFGPAEAPLPNGADDFYHLRRIWFSVVNFPASLDFDFYLNFPAGAPTVWTPTFDWLLAAAAKVLVGANDQRAVEGAVVWAAPALGALSVLAVAWLARRTFSRASGWASGAFLALLPAHVETSQLGVVDHHVAVGLAATLLLAAAMRLAEPVPSTARMRWNVLALGGMFGATLLLWPGALLQVLTIQLFLGLQLLATADRTTALLRARALAGVHVVPTLLLLPFCVGNEWPDLGPLTPWALSYFQPLWFGAATLGFAGAYWLWSRSRLGTSAALRTASALASVALGLAAAWLLLPGLREAMSEGASFFRPSPFLDVIAELSPLLYPDGVLDFTLAHHELSYLFWAYPIAAGYLTRWALARRRTDVLLLLLFSLVFAVLTLRQQRFTDVSAAGFVLVVAPAAVEAFRALRRRGLAPTALGAAAALTVAAGLFPYVAHYPAMLRESRATLQGARHTLTMDGRRAILTQRVAEWLREETPPTRGYLRADERPEYGVLAPWGQGHRIRYYAERPLVQDNFGPWGGRAGFQAAGLYYDSRTERRGVAIAGEVRARYVVATPFGSGQRLPLPGSLAERLALVPGDGRTLWFRPGSRPPNRHRLVFATDDRDLPRAIGERILTAAVYEIVEGALVTGCAPPTQTVLFETEVRLPGRAAVQVRKTARADVRGRYRIRLPQPSEAGYLVRFGPEEYRLPVTEADVREGRDVEGPCFAGTGARGDGER